VFIFYSVRFLSKKVTKPSFLKKKTKTGSNRPGSVQFGSVRFFRAKTGLAWFFWFGLVFFLVWLGFGPVFSGSVRFFRFQA
jgi:hypothetical protein